MVAQDGGRVSLTLGDSSHLPVSEEEILRQQFRHYIGVPPDRPNREKLQLLVTVQLTGLALDIGLASSRRSRMDVSDQERDQAQSCYAECKQRFELACAAAAHFRFKVSSDWQAYFNEAEALRDRYCRRVE